MITEVTQKLVCRQHLTAEESQMAVDTIMSGQASPALIAAFITALRVNGETTDEILGAARTMREKVTRIHHKQSVLIDNCGTGGDGAGTFNISTTAAFVLAGAGLTVAKHGNRSISSRCGSADVLQALGARIDLTPEQVGRCIDEIGIGFMFAPLLHPAMKAVAPVRKELGFRTIFNILGPLTNPAFATHQVIGVFDPEYTEVIAEAAAALGVRRVFVVHNHSGIDELAPTGVNKISSISNGSVSTEELDPSELGCRPCSVADLAGGSAEDNASITLSVLKGERGPAYDTVLLNGALGLLAGEVVTSLSEGVSMAREIIDRGKAFERLEEFIQYTSGLQNVA